MSADPLTLDLPIAEPGVMKNLVLDGSGPVTPAVAVSADVYFRWESEPDMAPQFLASTAAGHTLTVPFDIKGRAIRLYNVSKTADGRSSVSDITKAVQTVFTPGGVAQLADLAFATGTVTGTIANNGGTGTIRVLRRTGTDAFTEVTTKLPTDTTFTDSPSLDGTYDYQLTQDGIDGTSSTRSVVVSGVSGTTGTTPDTLDGDWDGSAVPLTWANHGATGSVIVERAVGGIGGPFTTIATLAAAATSYSDPVSQTSINVTYYYRVRNTSAAGYSNEITVFVPSI